VVAVGEEKRKAVRGILSQQFIGERRRAAAIRVDAPKRAARIAGVDDHIFAAPTATARPTANSCNGLRLPARNRHFLQLAVGEKRQPRIVGRPERVARAFRARQNPHCG
jgi:hypothetical protein